MAISAETSDALATAKKGAALLGTSGTTELVAAYAFTVLAQRLTTALVNGIAALRTAGS